MRRRGEEGKGRGLGYRRNMKGGMHKQEREGMGRKGKNDKRRGQQWGRNKSEGRR